MKEPDGANLDRIQIVKGWVDAKGEPQDKVFDVVWSGDRKPGKDGKVPAVGNTVDLKKATYTNAIGSGGADRQLDRHALRREAARALLRPGPADPDPALEHLRRGTGRPAAARGRAGDGPGAGLDLADLVHADKGEVAMGIGTKVDDAKDKAIHKGGKKAF